MAYSLRKRIALGLIMALTLGTAGHAQEVLGRYSAMIGAEDRRNSKGAPLTQPGQILAQERANFHRFGIRQQGDESDAYFDQQDMRAALPGLLARGQIEAAARSVITRGGVVTVEILGQGGRPTSLRVSAGPAAPAGTAEGNRAAARIDGNWVFRRAAREDTAMALVAGVDARLMLSCRRPASGAHPSGQFRLTLTAPGIAQIGQETVQLMAAIDGIAQGRLSMTLSRGPLEGAVPASSRLVQSLEAGNRLSLSHGGVLLVEAGLSGSSAALALLSEFCATPLDTPPSAALSAALADAAEPPSTPPTSAEPAGGSAAAGNEPVERGLEGEEEIRRQLALWLLGQRPSLVRTSSFKLPFELPPDYPAYEQPARPDRATLQQTYEFGDLLRRSRIEHLESVAARAASETVPDRITLLVSARLFSPEPGAAGRLRLGGYGKLLVNQDLQESVPAALRTLQLDLGPAMGRVLMRESAPLPLPLPPEIRALDAPLDPTGRPGLEFFPADDQYLKVTLSLSDPRVLLPQDVERVSSSGPVAEIAAQVIEARLYRKPRTRKNEPPAAEVLLATWQRGEVATPATGNLNTLASFAGNYAYGMEDGRLLSMSGTYREAAGMPRTIGPLGISPDAAIRNADLLIRANAVLERGPDRDFSPELLQMLLAQLVDPISRDGMVPPGFFGESGGLNEITRARVLRDAAPKLAAYIRERGPELPLPVRSRGMAELGIYDIGAEVFSYSLRPGELTYLQTPSGNRNLDGALDELTDALPVPLDAAEALLTQLDQDNLPGRSIPARLDMQLVSARALPQSGGPITMEELQRVVLTWEPEQLEITTDLAGEQTLLRHDFAPPAIAVEAEGAVPEAVYDTTAETLLGTWAAHHSTPTEFARRIAADRTFSRRMGQSPQSVIEARALEEAERLIASAQDSFWIGLSVQMGPYDETAQRIPLTDIAVLPIPARIYDDVDGLPTLHFPDRAAFDHLPATPEEYQLIVGIDGGRHALIFASVTLAEEQDRKGILTLKRPDKLLFLREDGNGGVSVTLTKELEAAPQLGLASLAAAETPTSVAPAAPMMTADASEPVAPPTGPLQAFEVPEVLKLDAEGLDLLAISLQPDLYDAPAFRRMFIERLARERADQRAGRGPQWGSFFADPALELTPSLVDALLPDFAAWSKARAAALPDRLLLQVGITGPHPETGCRAARPLPQAAVAERAAVAEVAGILPGVMPAAAISPVSDVTKPGGPVLHVVVGRPGHPSGPGGASDCDFIELRGTASDLASARTGLDAAAAPYVDALIQADMPMVARVTSSGPQAIDYELEPEDIRFHPLSPGAKDQPGLRGVLVIRAGVSAVETWQIDKSNRTTIRAERYDRDDWQSLLPSRDSSAFDILGLRLGSPLAEVEATVAARMPDAIRHVSPPVAQAGIYDHALGFSSADGHEVILSIYNSNDEAAPAVALMRYRFLPSGSATVDAVRQAVSEKYGPPDRDSGDHLAWGVPSQEIDSNQVCGGHKLFRGRNAPRLAPEKSRDEIQAGSPEGTYQAPEWGYYGWPVPFADYPDYQRVQAETYCGPVVLARIRSDVHEPGSVDLTVWILDKPEAERLATEAAKTAVVPELDMDL
ncbi:hypothetical protein RGQ15_13020 [Paracoccus sp. MBLB3053]|uniref:Uncharacterized protein n=1 Tax=Paracoccus aurantius TaxID=3073814 RepID=A0ABU2HV58_9RHOB|nr:hypothetical protein [Paracoccus sp. MBLB3053]MDS9468489.1 hypothetical protein [Paracoccus sp. MBLB3053]